MTHLNLAPQEIYAAQIRTALPDGANIRLVLMADDQLKAQVKMMNAIVRPEESRFDLRRFWEHSVGCALICDRLTGTSWFNWMRSSSSTPTGSAPSCTIAASSPSGFSSGTTSRK